MSKSQNVTIKGTKDGLLLRLDDLCSFSVLLEELKSTFPLQSFVKDDSHEVHLRVHTGNRFLTDEQVAQILLLLRPYENLVIDSIDSNVILKEEADRLIEESKMTIVNSIVRSGQVLHTPGDLLLIGDVNPSGTVMAGGNIYILGKLKGIAHAGCYGDEEAVIVAATMTPTQLRIAEKNRSFERDQSSDETECAYIDEDNQLIINRLQVLRKVRPNLTSLVEGGIHHG